MSRTCGELQLTSITTWRKIKKHDRYIDALIVSSSDTVILNNIYGNIIIQKYYDYLTFDIY